VRRRYSVAPDAPEVVDGSQLVGLTATIYALTRVALAVAGLALNKLNKRSPTERKRMVTKQDREEVYQEGFCFVFPSLPP
jgi:hypothetical protein